MRTIIFLLGLLSSLSVMAQEREVKNISDQGKSYESLLVSNPEDLKANIEAFYSKNKLNSEERYIVVQLNENKNLTCETSFNLGNAESSQFYLPKNSKNTVIVSLKNSGEMVIAFSTCRIRNEGALLTSTELDQTAKFILVSNDSVNDGQNPHLKVRKEKLSGFKTQIFNLN